MAMGEGVLGHVWAEVTQGSNEVGQLRRSQTGQGLLRPCFPTLPPRIMGSQKKIVSKDQMSILERCAGETRQDPRAEAKLSKES